MVFRVKISVSNKIELKMKNNLNRKLEESKSPKSLVVSVNDANLVAAHLVGREAAFIKDNRCLEVQAW